MKRNNTLFASLVVLSVSMVPLTFALAQEQGLGEAVTSGKAKVALRYRYEHVDQDNALQNANASTLRVRLNYLTADWSNWSGFIEFDHVAEVIVNDFNSGGGTSPGRVQYSTVADPRGSDLNQLYLQYKPSEDWNLRLGRQKILLDNHRFVGHVGWRQNEQTYDALGLNVQGIPNTTLFYSYVENVNRIFGDGAYSVNAAGDTIPTGNHSQNTHLLNAKIKLSDAWAVTPYAYYIDNEDISSFSSSTYGARLTGKAAVGDGSLNFVAEFANQSDAADNPVSYDADYAHLTVLWTAKNGLALGAAYESLGGDATSSGMSFRTPLATLHAFQGWADMLLSTPSSGVDDVYVTAKYKVSSWNLTAVYHDFSSEAGSSDYGTEFDFAAGRKLGERYGVLLKAAFFDADSGSPVSSHVDTNKFWVMFTANY